MHTIRHTRCSSKGLVTCASLAHAHAAADPGASFYLRVVFLRPLPPRGSNRVQARPVDVTLALELVSSTVPVADARLLGGAGGCALALRGQNLKLAVHLDSLVRSLAFLPTAEALALEYVRLVCKTKSESYHGSSDSVALY